jgi:hypothetical protein
MDFGDSSRELPIVLEAPPPRRDGPLPPLPRVAVNWGAAGIPPAPLTDNDPPDLGAALALPIPLVHSSEITDLQALFLADFSIPALVQMLG